MHSGVKRTLGQCGDQISFCSGDEMDREEPIDVTPCHFSGNDGSLQKTPHCPPENACPAQVS